MVSFQNLFVPNYISQIKKNGDIGGFQSSALLIVIILSIVLMSFAYLFYNFFLESLFEGHSYNFYAKVKSNFIFILPCLLFWSLTSFFSGLLEINGLFVRASIHGVFTPIITLSFLLFYGSNSSDNLLSVCLLIGSLFEFFFVLLVSSLSSVVCFRNPKFSDVGIRNMYHQFPLKVFSGFLSGSSGFINQFFAAQLVAGSLSSINFALKVPSFIVSVLAIAIGNVTLPLFSSLAFDNVFRLFIILNRVLFNVFLGSFVIVALLIYFSNDIISFFFQDGYFDYDDTLLVSSLMQIFLLYIPFYINGIVLNKVFTSLNKNLFLLVCSAINVIISLTLNTLLGKYYGIYGVAIATTGTSVLNYFVLIIFLRYVKFRLES
jgi:putative peptidoglycan lipid II flippase